MADDRPGHFSYGAASHSHMLVYGQAHAMAGLHSEMHIRSPGTDVSG